MHTYNIYHLGTGPETKIHYPKGIVCSSKKEMRNTPYNDVECSTAIIAKWKKHSENSIYIVHNLMCKQRKWMMLTYIFAYIC